MVLKPEARARAEDIAQRYPQRRSALLALLYLVQGEEGHLSQEGMKEVAQILGVSAADVLAVASFYTMYKRTPTGKWLLSVCHNLACDFHGAEEVIAGLESHLGIRCGETTADGDFTLERAECLAACDGAVVMEVNYSNYVGVTPQRAVDLVEACRAGRPEPADIGGVVPETHAQVCARASTSMARIPSAANELEEKLPVGGTATGPTTKTQSIAP